MTALMAGPPLAGRRTTLADRIFTRSIATDFVLVAAGAGITAIAAQLIVPVWPIPITGQTFAVLLVGSVLGPVRGALSMVLYLVLGVAGLPVFADGNSGSLLADSSGGFIVGFVFAAALTGWLAQREWDRRVLRTIASFAAGTGVMYLFGLPWLFVVLSTFPSDTMSEYFGTTDVLQATLTGGLYPFLVGDSLKALIAAAALPLTWVLVRRADVAAENSAR
jgi:biotin transport system substrate-specific component